MKARCFSAILRGELQKAWFSHSLFCKVILQSHLQSHFLTTKDKAYMNGAF